MSCSSICRCNIVTFKTTAGGCFLPSSQWSIISQGPLGVASLCITKNQKIEFQAVLPET